MNKAGAQLSGSKRQVKPRFLVQENFITDDTQAYGGRRD